MCRAARLEKASKEFHGLAQRSEQQATAFEHKVPSQLACLFLGNYNCSSQVRVVAYRPSQRTVRVKGWLTISWLRQDCVLIRKCCHDLEKLPCMIITTVTGMPADARDARYLVLNANCQLGYKLCFQHCCSAWCLHAIPAGNTGNTNITTNSLFC